MINEKKSMNAIKVKKLTDHIAYQIIGNTIYLLQKKVDISYIYGIINHVKWNADVV